MSGPIVVDVGNTRIKWGRSEAGRVVEMVAVPQDAPRTWREQRDRWAVAPTATWVISGVHPQHRQAFIEWLCAADARVETLEAHDPPQALLAVEVDEPRQVGIDRRLNAVAVNRCRQPGTAAVIVDAGSAVTVDLVDAAGAFRGGAIFPGLRLMARALHEHTALLPEVNVQCVEAPPGTNTTHAIRVGVMHAVVGGIERLIALYRKQLPAMDVYLTGGDAPLLLAASDSLGKLWPEMTLEGILHTFLWLTNLRAHTSHA